MKAPANIAEVFSSVQGEGLYVGCRQVFVRFTGCNAACRYCDTREAASPAATARIEQTPGSRDFAAVSNPIDISVLKDMVSGLLVSPHHSVSLTGGEPLCQAGAVAALAEKLPGRRYLETNGTMPVELEAVIRHIDIISMDIKLPGAVGRNYWREHRRFLSLAAQREVFVKVVIAGDTSLSEFHTAVELVAGVDRAIPMILQPVTPHGGCPAVRPETVLALQEKALSLLGDVRVIPQTHKMMGQL